MKVLVWTVFFRGLVLSRVWLLKGYYCEGEVFRLKNSSVVLKWEPYF